MTPEFRISIFTITPGFRVAVMVGERIDQLLPETYDTQEDAITAAEEAFGDQLEGGWHQRTPESTEQE